jgi:hypothetical protein
MYARIDEAYRVPGTVTCGSSGTGPPKIGCSIGGPCHDFNTQYKVNQLPKYQPYPTLHPVGESDSHLDQDIEDSLVRDPHQGAGWIQQRELCATRSPSNPRANPSDPQTNPSNPQTNPSDPRANPSDPRANPSEETTELINRVLANKYCRQLLRQILTEQTGGQPSKTSFDSETIKTIIMYCLGGLILLCLFDLMVKIGQLLKR